MALVLSGNCSCLIDRGNNFRARKNRNFPGKSFRLQMNSEMNAGSAKISLITGLVFLILALAFSGIIYIYEINSMATKGYEIKEVENQIKELEKEGKKLKIKEVELKSMYNIEKSVKDLELVSPSNITYVEVKSPVAMK